MMHIDFPFHFDTGGRTAKVNNRSHIRNLIEQVLFTLPGERVNRPEFGSNVGSLLFEPNSDVLAAATQMIVQSSLHRWLGDLIEVNDVTIENDDATLRVIVAYTVLGTQEFERAEFKLSGDVS